MRGFVNVPGLGFRKRFSQCYKCFCPWFALRAVVVGDVVAFGEVGAFAALSLASPPLSLYAQHSVLPLRYIIFLLQVFMAW